MQISTKVHTSVTSAMLLSFLGVASTAGAQTAEYVSPTVTSKTEMTTLIDMNRLHLGDNFRQAEQANKTAFYNAQQAQDQPQMAQVMTDSAILSTLEQDGGAQPKAEEALNIRKRLFGESSPQVAESLNTVALIHLTNKNYTAAQEQAKAALALEYANPERDALRIADSYDILAKAMLQQAGNTQGEKLANMAMDIHLKALGPSNPAVARDLFTLANFALLKGDTDKARDLFSRSLNIADDLQKPSDLLALSTLSAIDGKMNESKQLFEKCMTVCNSKYGAQHPVSLGTRALYVKVLWNHQRWLEALQSRADLPVSTSSIASLTAENTVFEKAIQTPQIHTYNWQNVALCLMFTVVPLGLLAVMVLYRNAFKVPTSHGFNEFIEKSGNVNPTIAVNQAARAKMGANTTPSGRLALKNLRDADLAKHK